MKITTTYALRDFYFDRPKVYAAINRAEARALPRIGAFVRRRARSQLRRRKRISGPGESPSIHSPDSASLKTILFGYEPRKHSVVVGPIKLNQANYSAAGSRITIPALMEFGGSVRIYEERRKRSASQWYRSDLRMSRRPWKEYRSRTARYPARPFMGPALEAEIKAGSVTAAWRSTVSAGL